ncbi:hypothetical protein PS15m_000219 [Mucor circinelloides]
MKLYTSSDNRSAYKNAAAEMNGYAAGLGIKYGPTTAASASTEKPGSNSHRCGQNPNCRSDCGVWCCFDNVEDQSLTYRRRLDLRLLVWKEDSALFDGGTGEVAKMAIQSKLFSDKLKSVLATKCHLNDFLNSARCALVRYETRWEKNPMFLRKFVPSHLLALHLEFVLVALRVFSMDYQESR